MFPNMVKALSCIGMAFAKLLAWKEQSSSTPRPWIFLIWIPFTRITDHRCDPASLIPTFTHSSPVLRISTIKASKSTSLPNFFFVTIMLLPNRHSEATASSPLFVIESSTILSRSILLLSFKRPLSFTNDRAHDIKSFPESSPHFPSSVESNLSPD